jgi:hypothetical protein
MEVRVIYEKINNIRPASYKFVRKVGIMQGNLPTKQVSNRRTRNNRNQNNQPDGLNRWEIMTSNGSKSLNNIFMIARKLPVCAIVENTWHKCVEWFYKRQEVTTAWEAQVLIFSYKVTELIKRRGDKGRTYDIVPLDWSINNYDVYNINGLIETVIFYTYIFLFNFKF